MSKTRRLVSNFVLATLVTSTLGATASLATTPSVPTGVTVNASATSDFEQATIRVTWNANTQVDGYTVYLKRTGASTDLEFKTIAQANTTEWTFNNLAGGISYAAQVIAIKSGVASARSSEVSSTPTTKPKAPDRPSVAAGIRSATVSWSAVPAANNGGSPITSYLVTEMNSNKQVIALATESSKEVTGLNPGATVEFTVAAVNAASTTGSISVRSTAIVLANVPTAPTALNGLSAEDGKLTTSWTPAGDGGSPITSQKIYLYKNSVELPPQILAATTTSYTFTELSSGSYQVKVSAINAVGEGAKSSFSSAIPVTAVQVINVVTPPSSNSSNSSNNAGGGGAGGGGGGFFGAGGGGFSGGGGGGGFAPAPTTPIAESEEEKKKKLAAEEEEKKKADEEKLALEKAEREKAAAAAKEKEDLAKAAQNAAPTPAPSVTPAQKNSVPAPRATAAAKAEVLKILTPNSAGMLALAKPSPTLASAVVAKSTSRDTLQVAIKPPTIKSGEKITAYQVVITSATGKKKAVTLKGNSAGAVNIKGLTSTAPYTLEISAVVNGKSKVVAKTKVTLATKKKK